LLVQVITVSSLLVIGMVINMLCAGNDYTLELIENIIVSIALILYIFYMIVNYISVYVEKVKMYSAMINADDNDEYLIYKDMDIKYQHDRLIVARLDFVNKKGEDRTVYCDLSNLVYLEKNKEYKIKTLANYLVEVK